MNHRMLYVVAGIGTTLIAAVVAGVVVIGKIVEEEFLEGREREDY